MKVLDQALVAPPPGSVPESALPLTFFDIIWLDHPPVERCFFYHLPYSTLQLVQSYIPSLKTSLSLALRHFHPLVAKVVQSQSPHSDEHFELRYSENNSVPFRVVETDDNFLDLTGCHPRDFPKLLSLRPEIGDSLLAVQITIFPNQGICIGVSVHHVACDGFSYLHFMKTWAATCRSDLSIPLPSFDRTAPASLDELYSFLIKERHRIKSSQVKEMAENQTDDYVIATIKLGSEHIKRLKQLVHSSFHTSTFVLTCAYLWICWLKLQKIGADQTVCFPIAVDWRQRLQPRAPEWYFGNCVFFTVVVLNAGDILKDNGLGVASEGIGRAIDELKEGIAKTFARAMDSYCVMNMAFTIAGSPRLRVYETDFGWGKPVKVEIVSIKNEALALAESREDPGGVEIGVVLPKQEMEEFTAIFNEGFDLL